MRFVSCLSRLSCASASVLAQPELLHTYSVCTGASSKVLTYRLISFFYQMDNLIKQISHGVGKSKRRSITFAYGSGKRRTKSNIITFKRRNGCSIIASDESSDDDFCLTAVKNASRKRGKPGAMAVHRVTEVNSEPDYSIPSSAQSTWINDLPIELLLKIFQLATQDNPDRLKLLLRLSKVCRFWREVAADPSLWTSLDLSFGWVTSISAAVASLSANGRLSNLETLSVAGNIGVNPAFIKLVIQEFPKLKSLDISRCKNITPKGMELLHEGFPHLIALSACKMGSSTLSQSLAGLIRSHRDTLQRVEVSEIRWAPATLMTEIALLKNLTKLDISDTMLAGTTRFLDFLRKHCCCLQILRVAYCGFNTRANEDITTPIPFAELIELSAAGLDWQSLREPDIGVFIKMAPKLKYLDIRGWKYSMLASLSHESLELPSLQSLNLADTTISIFSDSDDINIAKISHSLQELDISRIKGLSAEACDTLFSSFCIPNRTLKFLHCSALPITTDQLRQVLSTCEELEVLDLSACRELERGLKKKYSTKSEIQELKSKLLGDKQSANKAKRKE